MARVLIAGFCAVPAPMRSGVQMRHVVRALSPDHAVDLLVIRDGDQAYVERQGGVRILRVPIHDEPAAAQIQAFQRALRRQLEGADYDIVHCRDGWSATTGLEARARLGYTVVFDLTRAPLDTAVGLEPAVDVGLVRDEDDALVDADLVLVPTEAARRYVQARSRAGRVMLAPPGVDVDRFDWDPPTAGPPRIVYVGGVAPGDAIRLVLRAMADIAAAPAGRDARLVLAGPIAPGFDAVVHGTVAELGLDGKVELLGPVDHDAVPALLATATVCLAPSAAEVTARPCVLYPTKILEYLACRRAVVAARRGSVSTIIEHGRDGLLFIPGDAADLASKVLRLLDDAPLRERLAAAGYERVRRELTASGARRAIRAAYASLSADPSWHPRESRPDLRPPTDSWMSPAGARPATVTGEGPISDDDFEATVYEVSVSPEAGLEASLSSLDDALESSLSSLDAALAVLDSGRADPGTDEHPAARPDDTPIGDHGSDGEPRAWQLPGEDWAVASLADLVPGSPGGSAPAPRPRAGSEDDGTPIDVHALAAPVLEVDRFVSGEIDVPRDPDGTDAFTAASRLQGGRGDRT